MKIYVAAKAGAKQNKIEELEKGRFRVYVKAPPEQGEANEAIREVLADYLGCPKLRLTLLSGHRSKNKIFGFH